MESHYTIGMSNRTEAKADVLQGTLDLMVLQTVAALGPRHGYAIAARLEQVSGGALRLNMGTLYPALMRLEQRGLLRAHWSVTESNRRARFYAITAAGRRRLATERAEWDRMAAIMRALLQDA
jgi:transcriptional regulator